MFAEFFSASGTRCPGILVVPAAPQCPPEPSRGTFRALRCRWEYRPEQGRLVQIWETKASAGDPPKRPAVKA